MSRRRVVVLTSAALLLLIVGALGVTVALLTRTSWGRERLRAFAENRLRSAIQGKVHLGRVSGSVFTGLAIDSIEIRGLDDSLFVAASHVEVNFDPRDLVEQRIILRGVRASHAVVHVTQDSSGQFNFRRIFPSGPPGPPRTTPGWGDYITLHDAKVDSLEVMVRTLWQPPRGLRGARLDSAIAAVRARPGKEIVRGGSEWYQVRYLTGRDVALDSARLDDKAPGGRTFAIRHIDLDVSDPPFSFRDTHGHVRIDRDTLWANLPRFHLPGSRGSLTGRVWWAGGERTRMDLSIEADTVSLADVRWVYPTLPAEGGGKLHLTIRSDDDPAIVDYAITDMNVRSTFSWLRGDMTFGIGAPVPILHDVDLVAQPLDFRLIETLAGEPLPLPWRGTLEGWLRARGGPLDRFEVDSAAIVFRDANVPGAVASGRASGELDISEPGTTVFHGFRVVLDSLDLRTLQFLNPAFPRLNGTVAGRATLDSSWLDVRFRDADVTHRYGSTTPTRMIGAGRVTFGEEATSYDVALTALPIAFHTLARAYQGGRIPLRGEYEGPLRLQGTLSDLALNTELRGTAGEIGYDGRVDADSTGGYGVHGTVRLGSTDLRTLLDTAVTPHTTLTGLVTLDLTARSPADMRGSAQVELERSIVDGLRVYPSRARARFADGRMMLDTLQIESVAGVASGRGALGLRADVKDTLTLVVTVDSLGWLRRYLPSAAVENGEPVNDSLRGEFDGTVRLIGSVDTLGLQAFLRGTQVNASGVSANRLRVDAALERILRAPTGTLSLTGDTVVVGGVRLRSAAVDGRIDQGRTGTYNAMAIAETGPVLQAQGDFERTGDTTTVAIRDLGVLFEGHRLALLQPTTVRVAPDMVAVDTLRVRGGAGEEFMVVATLPDSAPLNAAVQVNALHLHDLGDLLQTRLPLGGTLTMRVEASGTRDNPAMNVVGQITGATVGDVTVTNVDLRGRYANQRLQADVTMAQRGVQVLEATATIPVDLPRRRLLDDSMRVTLSSNDVDLGLVETFTPSVRGSRGRFTANLDMLGSRGARRLNGFVRITDGAGELTDLGIRLRNVNVDLVAERDTLRVNRLALVSGDEASDSLWVVPGGWIAHPLDTLGRAYDLRVRARDFHGIGRPALADLTFSADLSLRGPRTNVRGQGSVTVNSGHIALPEFSDKKLFPLDDSVLVSRDRELAQRVNLLRQPLMPSGLTVSDLTVRIGPDVWLYSNDANIKLSDSLNVTVARAADGRPILALEGALRTERGYYILNIGLVRRTFTIDSGEVRFFGDTTIGNAELDITATHRVRQISTTLSGRHDVRIGARLSGTVNRPDVSLFSADSVTLSESDLISYLVTGAPSFGIGGSFRENAATASAILFGSATSLLTSRFSGGLFDFVEIQTAADQLRTTRIRDSDRFLLGAQLGLGMQLNDRTFFTLNTGLCPFGQLFRSGSSIDPMSIAGSMGAQIEHRFGTGYGVSASLEPPLSALVCSQATDPGLFPSRRQFGFDLFRLWRF
ncbi:MAG TPA: translocation/assembly module TamB domain-containing protein [Gemmatimonadaceae bacterium]